MGKAIIYLMIGFMLIGSVVALPNFDWFLNPYTGKFDRSLSLNQSGNNFTANYYYGDGSHLTGNITTKKLVVNESVGGGVETPVAAKFRYAAFNSVTTTWTDCDGDSYNIYLYSNATITNIYSTSDQSTTLDATPGQGHMRLQYNSAGCPSVPTTSTLTITGITGGNTADPFVIYIPESTTNLYVDTYGSTYSDAALTNRVRSSGHDYNLPTRYYRLIVEQSNVTADNFLGNASYTWLCNNSINWEGNVSLTNRVIADNITQANQISAEVALQSSNNATQSLEISRVLNSTTNYFGSACTGNEGTFLRNLTISKPPKIVLVDNQFLQPNIDFTYSYATGKITFLNMLWDDQRITVFT